MNIKIQKIFGFATIIVSACYSPLLCHAEPFDTAKKDFNFSFPKDHGSHPNFKTEWWYYTGNLYKEGDVPFKDAPSYGYQLTFFRQKSDPSQGYLAHAAFSDFKNKTHSFESLKAPGIFDFAGALENRLKVWNKSWLSEMIQNNILLKFSVGSISTNMVLATDSLQPILQGDNGYSKKGSCDTCASQYVSFSRIPTKAELYHNTTQTKLTGISWMDHEFMSNTLQPNQTGWDWFSLITKDGTEVMLFKVRAKDTKDDFYSGSCIVNGVLSQLSAKNYSVTPTKYWVHNSTKYPSEWKIESKICNNLNVTIKTRIDNQLLTFPYEQVSSYYEGAVHSLDESVIGYVELTGYEKDISGAL
jgi:predicted secreted hydrolase